MELARLGSFWRVGACSLALRGLVACSDAAPEPPVLPVDDSADPVPGGEDPSAVPVDGSLAPGALPPGGPGNVPPAGAPIASGTPGPDANPSGEPGPGTTTEPTPSGAPPPTAGLRTVPIQNVPNKVLSRLTHAQFLNAASALLGENAIVGVAPLLPEQVPNGGFGNSGFAQSQPYDVVLAYDTAARQVATNLTDLAAVHARWGGCTDFSCVDTFVQSLGERAFRRPLTSDEVAALRPISDLAQAEGLDYDGAVRLLVRAFLQAPEFLYHFEDAELSDYQLASRLAFFVTDGPPDDALHAEAAAGTLRSTGVLAEHAARLLEQSGDRFGRAFAYDFLALRRAYQRVVISDDVLISELVASAQDTFAEFVRTDAPVSALFTTDAFQVNDTTAAFMGVTANAGTVTSSATTPFLGLVTHPATLIAMSNAVEGSMVSRGQFLAHQLLCIPPTPPPAMAFNPEDAGELPPNPTQRDEAILRLQNPSCNTCHLQFEPYAFGLNKWGGDGMFKDDLRLDDAGPITTSLGTLEFTGYRDFLPQLGDSEQYRRCITDQLLRYGLRHTDYPADLVDQVRTLAGDSAVTFRGLVVAIVVQEVFAQR